MKLRLWRESQSRQVAELAFADFRRDSTMFKQVCIVLTAPKVHDE